LDAARRFEPRALCSLELLGDPWTPRAAHFEPRAFCSLELLGDPWTPRAARFEQRALCSLELLGDPWTPRAAPVRDSISRMLLRLSDSCELSTPWRPATISIAACASPVVADNAMPLTFPLAMAETVSFRNSACERSMESVQRC